MERWGRGSSVSKLTILEVDSVYGLFSNVRRITRVVKSGAEVFSEDGGDVQVIRETTRQCKRRTTCKLKIVRINDVKFKKYIKYYFFSLSCFVFT